VNINRSQRALELFSQQYSCAQSVFAGCTTSEHLSEAQRLALAAPFGGGVAGQGEICGALTGALLALGEAGGEAIATDPAAGSKAPPKRVLELIEAFRRAHGSILCRELTGCSFNTEAGQRSFEERELHKNLCSNLVAFAATQVDEVMAAISPQNRGSIS
jgi:C_GCAxxG_C_C family probable redox protein